MSTTITDPTLDNFLAMFLNNLNGLKRQSPQFKIIAEADQHWKDLLYGHNNNFENFPVYALIGNAHSLFRSAMILSFAGNTAAVTGILRICLESCLYAFMISKAPDLGVIWIERWRGPEQRNVCIRNFSAKKAINLLNETDSKLSDLCSKLYETFIEYGAHPNIQGAFANFQRSKTNEGTNIQMSYIHGNEHETHEAVLGCCMLIKAALELACYTIPVRAHEVGIGSYLDIYKSDFNAYFNPAT